MVVVAVAVSILVLPSRNTAQEQQPAPQPRHPLFVAIYERGPAWDPAKSVFEQSSIQDHMQYLRANITRLIGAAPFQEAFARDTSDRVVGMVIVSATSAEEAQAFVNADPAVSTGLMKAFVRRWLADRVRGY